MWDDLWTGNHPTAALLQWFPRVIMHDHFSKTNVLVNSDSYWIVGIIDWSVKALKCIAKIYYTLFFAVRLSFRFKLWNVYTTRYWIQVALALPKKAYEEVRAAPCSDITLGLKRNPLLSRVDRSHGYNHQVIRYGLLLVRFPLLCDKARNTNKI